MKIRIILPAPNHSGVSKETRKSIFELIASKICEFEYFEMKAAWCSKGRNAGIEDKGTRDIRPDLGNWDAILHVDADTQFTHENVLRLININRDIISAAYSKRDFPENIVAGFWNDETGAQFIDNKETGIKEVGFVGHGLCLVKKSVYEKLEYPWYEMPIIRVGNKAFEVGEDIAFCRKAAKEGFKIFVDCDNRIKHITEWGNEKPEIKKFQAMKGNTPISNDLFISEVLSDASEISTKALALAQLVKNIIQQQN
jgi:hypothetical protein